MFRYLAVPLMLAAAAIAYAQPVYEIGYAFNGSDEVSRVEPAPFSVSIDSGIAPPTIQDLFLSFPFTDDPQLGLVNIEGEFDIDLDEAQPFESIGRVSVTFDDLVFASSESEPIVVDLFVDPGSTLIYSSFLPFGASTVYESHIEIELAGQVSVGTTRLIWDGDGLPRREWTGIFESGSFGFPWSADGFTVPVNEPVSLRFQLTRTVSIPPTSSTRLRFESASESGRGPGLHVEGYIPEPYADVFRLPPGVRVDSAQASIRDNRVVRCPPDLDADGELTIFDFLTFQNLFDTGDLTADYDFDGALTLFDFLAFQNAFDAGCP